MKGTEKMTNKQFNSFLEALKIIIKTANKKDILKYIEQIQTKLNE